MREAGIEIRKRRVGVGVEVGVNREWPWQLLAAPHSRIACLAAAEASPPPAAAAEIRDNQTVTKLQTYLIYYIVVVVFEEE